MRRKKEAQQRCDSAASSGRCGGHIKRWRHPGGAATPSRRSCGSSGKGRRRAAPHCRQQSHLRVSRAAGGRGWRHNSDARETEGNSAVLWQMATKFQCLWTKTIFFSVLEQKPPLKSVPQQIFPWRKMERHCRRGKKGKSGAPDSGGVGQDGNGPTRPWPWIRPHGLESNFYGSWVDPFFLNVMALMAY